MSDAPQATPDSVSALPKGTRLGEFEVKSVLGAGGFGIVYLAFDHALEREVAIKEYMPVSMAGRTETLHVSLHSQGDAEVFALGKRSFVNEAKLLARFEHPALIKVYRFWEANGTAYMAMPVLRGRSLKVLRRSTNRAPDEALLRGILEPLLGGLEKLHSEGVFHRDIAPDNIYLEPDGHPVLLDFGAARRVIGDKTQSLTAILKPAYAPIEQYAEAGSVKQGPWTDLYALGATMHFMLLGQPPPPATARTVFDEGTGLSQQNVPGCSRVFLEALDWMLAPRPAERPQSVAQLREVLQGRATPPVKATPAPAPPPVQSWERTVLVPPGGGGSSAAPDVLIEPTFTQPPRDSRAGPPSGFAAAAGARSVSAPPRARSLALPLVLVGAVAAAGAGWFVWRGMDERGGAAPAASQAVVGSAGGSTAATTVAAPATTAATPATTAAATAYTGAAAGTTGPAPAAASVPAVASAAASAAHWLPASGVTPSVAGAAAPGVAAVPGVAAPAEASAAPTPAPQASPAPAPPVETAAAPAPPRRPTTTAAAPRTPAASAARRPAATETAARTSTAAAPPAIPPAVPPATTTTSAGPPPSNLSSQRGESGPSNPSGAQPVAAAALPAASRAAAPADTTPDPNPNLAPEARCGGRNPLSYFVCMERECLRGRWQSHPDCQAWRRNARPQQGN
jgi:serine/threonine protein kinase